MLLFSTGTLLSKWSATTWASWSPAGAPPLTGPDLALVLPSWRAQVTDADRLALSRVIARRLVRTGFTLVMPRWGGWTSDLGQAAQLFNSYYPERAGQMRLAAEYTAVHGVKAPR
jgi:hypothetical protein